MNHISRRWSALRRAGLCLVGFGMVSMPAGSAALGDTPAQVLAARGLKASGWVYVVDGEAAVIDKFAEAKASYRDWVAGRSRLEEQQENQATLDELAEQKEALKADLDLWKRQVGNQGPVQQPGGYGQGTGFAQPGGLGPGGGFGQTGFSQQMQTMQDGQMIAQINEAQEMLTQLTGEMNRLKKLALSPQEKQKLADENSGRRDGLRSRAVELRKSVDATSERYRALKGDPAVEQALAALGREGNAKLKLGPSREFQAAAKSLEKIESALASPGATAAGPSKAARKLKLKTTAPAKRAATRRSPAR